jgi:hypothetical protein
MTDETKFAVTSASEWKKASEKQGLGGRPIPLEVPSGKTAVVRPVGLQAFFELGLIPNSLLGILEGILAKAKGGKAPKDADIEKVMADLGKDPQKIVDLLKMADAVCIHSVIDPKIHPTPGPEEERSDELLYADEVDLEDKLFIMNFAFGGARDLEPFRAQLARNVAPVPAGKDVGGSAVRPARSRAR